LIEAQYPFPFSREPGAAAAFAADAAFYQRFLREVVQFINGIPSGLVAQASTLGGAGDGALFGDMPQQGDALGAADDMLAQ